MAEFRLLQDRDKEQASALWQECFGDSDGFCRTLKVLKGYLGI